MWFRNNLLFLLHILIIFFKVHVQKLPMLVQSKLFFYNINNIQIITIKDGITTTMRKHVNVDRADNLLITKIRRMVTMTQCHWRVNYFYIVRT